MSQLGTVNQEKIPCKVKNNIKIQIQMDILKTIGPIAIEQAAKYYVNQGSGSHPSGTLATEASANNTSAVKSILAKSPLIDRAPALVAASSAGNLSVLDLLLEPPQTTSRHHHHQPSSSSKSQDRKVDLNVWSAGTTPLLAAVKTKHAKTTKYLLQSGADPDLCDKSGSTALQLASKNGDLEIVRVLLSFGAEVDYRNADGDTALIIASRWGHARTARVLLENGANIEARNAKGGSALLVAARHDCVEVLEILLKKGADVRVRDKKGRGVLHRVVEGVNFVENVPVKVKEGMVRDLLEAGANPAMRDAAGKTAGQRAGWLNGGEELRRLLDVRDFRKREHSYEGRRSGEVSRSKTM
jgi:hypothetical protein